MSTCLFPDTGPWTFWWFISNSTTRGLYPDLLIAKGASFPSCSGKTGSYWRIGIEEPLDSHSDSGEFTIDIQILWRFGVEHLEPKWTEAIHWFVVLTLTRTQVKNWQPCFCYLLLMSATSAVWHKPTTFPKFYPRLQFTPLLKWLLPLRRWMLIFHIVNCIPKICHLYPNFWSATPCLDPFNPIKHQECTLSTSKRWIEMRCKGDAKPSSLGQFVASAGLRLVCHCGEGSKPMKYIEIPVFSLGRTSINPSYVGGSPGHQGYRFLTHAHVNFW